MKLHRTALALAAAALSAPALAQYATPVPNAVSGAPDVMPKSQLYTDPRTFIVPRYGFSENLVSVTCGGSTGVTCAPGVTAPTVFDGQPTEPHGGAARVNCRVARMGFEDPIVKSGRPGETHGHMFFGLNNTNAFTDVSNPRAAGGNSTCNGGLINMTAYWTPLFQLECGSTAYATECDPYGGKTGAQRNGEVQIPGNSLWYYKFQKYQSSDIEVWPPTGLRYFWGNPNNVTGPTTGDFVCMRGGVVLGGTFDHIPTAAEAHALQPGGCDEINARIEGPDCWDGVNLDSPDHQSHMANSTSAGCPAGWKSLPRLMLNVHLPVKVMTSDRGNGVIAGDLDHWRVASDPKKSGTSPAGGKSWHFDVAFGWDTGATNCGGFGTLSCPEQIMKACHAKNDPVAGRGYDCGANLIGQLPDGRGLKLEDL